MSEWWEGFFDGAWLDVQRALYTEEETEAQAALVARRLGLAPPAQILDVPCGEGRISRALARRGFRMTGVDRNARLLEEARRSAAAGSLAMDLVERDMRDLDFDAAFDGACCWWGSFGYFADDAEDLRFLRAVARALVPGGRFVLETHIAESLLPRYQPRGWHRVGDVLVLEERSLDLERGRIVCDWTFVRDGKTEQSRTSIRLYTYRELCALVREAGFGELGAFAGEAPFTGPSTPGRFHLVGTSRR
jgi:SAM-dependent methyltransferase